MLRSVFVTLWVIAGLSGCGADSTVETSPAVRPARLITVGAGDHSAPSQFVGKVASAHTVELGFEIDGTLQQLPLREGALVQAGDIIAQLDPERFELALEINTSQGPPGVVVGGDRHNDAAIGIAFIAAVLTHAIGHHSPLL